MTDRIVRGVLPPDQWHDHEVICYEPIGAELGVFPHFYADYVPPVPSFVERRAKIAKECAAENARLEKAKERKKDK